MRMRWLGHASTVITDRETTVLTDPVLTMRVAHLRRRRGEVPYGPGVHDPDVVLLSHLHADHTDLPSLRRVIPRAPIIVPRGAPDRFPALRSVGHRLIEVSAGDETPIGGLTIRAVPAEHDGRRWRFGPRIPDALGYLVCGDVTTYFAGDTDVYAGLADWVQQPDLALLPVGGWGPTKGDGHMDPAGAVQAAATIAARRSVPIHFGTLWPIGLGFYRSGWFYDHGARFVELAQRAGLDAVELRPGEEIEVRG